MIYYATLFSDGNRCVLMSCPSNQAEYRKQAQWRGLDFSILSTSAGIRHEASAVLFASALFDLNLTSWSHQLGHGDIPWVDNIMNINVRLEKRLDYAGVSEEQASILDSEPTIALTFFGGSQIQRNKCYITIDHCTPYLGASIPSPLHDNISRLTGFTEVHLILERCLRDKSQAQFDDEIAKLVSRR